MALQLANSGSWLSTTTNLPPYPCTLMGWFNVASDNELDNVCLTFGDTVGNFHTKIGIDLKGANSNLFMWNGAARTAGSAVSLNTWYHIAMAARNPAGSSTADDNQGYLNGVFDINNANTSNSVSAETITIGNDPTGAYFNGAMAAIKIYDIELTAAQIQDEMWTYLPQRLENLNRWCPLIVNSEAGKDFSGLTRDLTEVGTLNNVDGPPIIWGGRRRKLFGLLPTIPYDPNKTADFFIDSFSNWSASPNVEATRNSDMFGNSHYESNFNVTKNSNLNIDATSHLSKSTNVAKTSRSELFNDSSAVLSSNIDRLLSLIALGDSNLYMERALGGAITGDFLLSSIGDLFLSALITKGVEFGFDSSSNLEKLVNIARDGGLDFNSQSDLFNRIDAIYGSKFDLNGISNLQSIAGISLQAAINLFSNSNMDLVLNKDVGASLVITGLSDYSSSSIKAVNAVLVVNGDSNWFVDFQIAGQQTVNFVLSGLSSVLVSTEVLKTLSVDLLGLSDLTTTVNRSFGVDWVLDGRSSFINAMDVIKGANFDLSGLSDLYTLVNIDRGVSLGILGDSYLTFATSAGALEQGDFLLGGDSHLTTIANVIYGPDFRFNSNSNLESSVARVLDGSYEFNGQSNLEALFGRNLTFGLGLDGQSHFENLMNKGAGGQFVFSGTSNKYVSLEILRTSVVEINGQSYISFDATVPSTTIQPRGVLTFLLPITRTVRRELQL